MSKLEFHHYSSYLPYGVKYRSENTGKPVLLHPNNINMVFDKNLKMYLHPLKDLITEWDNGIIPIMELAKICFDVENMRGNIQKSNCTFSKRTAIRYSDWKVRFKTFSSQDPNEVYELWIIDHGSSPQFRFKQYVHGGEYGHALDNIIPMIEKMKEMKMDCFNLIDRGLALDINEM